MNKLGARHTVAACYIGYITQAIVNNFAPLLFLTFQEDFSLSLTVIGTLVTVNFGVQLLVDLISSKIVDKLGYRPCMVAAHLFAAAGLCMLAFLPRLLPLPAAGLFIASAVYAVGGGLIEVLISPTIEACPSKNKKASMSMLHSFYCWGRSPSSPCPRCSFGRLASAAGMCWHISGRRCRCATPSISCSCPSFRW